MYLILNNFYLDEQMFQLILSVSFILGGVWLTRKLLLKALNNLGVPVEVPSESPVKTLLQEYKQSTEDAKEISMLAEEIKNLEQERNMYRQKAEDIFKGKSDGHGERN